MLQTVIGLYPERSQLVSGERRYFEYNHRVDGPNPLRNRKKCDEEYSTGKQRITLLPNVDCICSNGVCKIYINGYTAQGVPANPNPIVPDDNVTGWLLTIINTFILSCFRIYLIEVILLSMIIIVHMIAFTIFCAFNYIKLIYLVVCLSNLEEIEEVITVFNVFIHRPYKQEQNLNSGKSNENLTMICWLRRCALNVRPYLNYFRGCPRKNVATTVDMLYM